MNNESKPKDGEYRWFRATTKPVHKSWNQNEAFKAIKKSKKAVQLQFLKKKDPCGCDLWHLKQIPSPGWGSVMFNTDQVKMILVPDISHNLELI